MLANPMELYLKPSANVNFKHDSVQAYIQEFKGLKDKKECAILLYEKVRDGFLYDPFHLDISPNALVASEVLQKKRAWCVEKSLVLIACLRALEIPARFGFAIVVNHLGIEKLETYLKRKEIVFHGFVSVFLEGKWVICTPAFDRKVCRFAGVEPLVWDGETDSLFQEFTADKRHMEYIKYYGFFDEIPFELMRSEMQLFYPHLFEEKIQSKEFSFDY
jgi:hypothetical protein